MTHLYPLTFCCYDDEEEVKGLSFFLGLLSLFTKYFTEEKNYCS